MITITGSNPADLLAKIRKAIDDGHVTTWEYDTEGDFTHITSDKQWYKEAWFRPSEENGDLIFGIVGTKGTMMTKVLYGIYHGRFSEMLLSHFDKDFSSLALSALAVKPPDIFS